MVSILIPVFGENIDNVLMPLAHEATMLNFDVEVLVFDDASRNPKPPGVAFPDNVRFSFRELDANLGRAGIRNLLAKSASFDKLVFVDAECVPVREDFIRRYLEAFDPGKVVVGGQLFSQRPPDNPSRMLRWKYGAEVETRSLDERRNCPYRSFMANNFMIARQMILKNPFYAGHTRYGHEDTLFGEMLRQKGIEVVHIDNPVLHLVDEDSAEFIDKTREAMANMAGYYRSGMLGDHLKLIQAYKRLKKVPGAIALTRWYWRLNQKRIMNNLAGLNPSMKNFALFKLNEFISRMEDQSRS